MKALDGLLDTTKRYKIIGYSIDDYCTCDNCKTPMSQPVFIKDEQGKEYKVGQDCAKQLEQDRRQCIDYFELKETLKKIRRDKKFIKAFDTHFAIIDKKNIWLYEKETYKWNSFWKFRVNINSEILKHVKSINVSNVCKET